MESAIGCPWNQRSDGRGISDRLRVESLIGSPWNTQFAGPKKKHHSQWGGFSKGADGILVEEKSNLSANGISSLRIHAIVEVKSMAISPKRIIEQIDKNIQRLDGGVKLGEKVWPGNGIDISQLVRIFVIPSKWKLSRNYKWLQKTDDVRELFIQQASEPPIQTQIEELKPNTWKVTLAWSQEVLAQAAYAMTFWYMSEVGKRVYTKDILPKDWSDMTPAKAGYNAIKLRLHHILLRFLTKRHARIAVHLYNAYSFPYPLAIDSHDVLWPEEFPDNGEN
ncbi:MAG: hypothetical protein V2A78_03435 [bacterium]